MKHYSCCEFVVKMGPSYFNSSLIVFLVALVSNAKSQTENSIVSDASSNSERCVCQPQVTIYQPVCGRSASINSPTSYNCTANQEIVFSELRDIKHQLDQLQMAISVLAGLQLTNNTNGHGPTVTFAKDCSEVLARGMAVNGVYTIQPVGSGFPIQIYCDMNTDGGGWTVFQRRLDGTVDFYRDFASYRHGFGDLDGEFWLGNDNLHRLTAQGDYQLRVDLTDFEGNSAYAVYDLFNIGDVNDNFRLTIGGYNGTAGDAMNYHDGWPFTTKDRDNDNFYMNCAEFLHGAWWYESCSNSNLNGNYLRGVVDSSQYAQGVVWRQWKGHSYSLKTSEMKIRTTN